VNDFGCKGSAWDHSSSDESGMGDWKVASYVDDTFRGHRANVSGTRGPSKSYSKRSFHTNELREQSKWQTENAGFDLVAPTKLAVAAAESFINNLSEGSLDLDMAISHSGEINFFFGGKTNKPFQVLIDESGYVSFYGEILSEEKIEEIQGSEVLPSSFPYLKLLKFVDRNK